MIRRGTVLAAVGSLVAVAPFVVSAGTPEDACVTLASGEELCLVLTPGGATSTTLPPSTSSSLPPSSTTTSTSSSTTTSTSTSTTTSSSLPASSTSTTLAPEPTVGFFEDFNGNPSAMSRFRFGALNRDIFNQASSVDHWQADHAFLGGGDCTTPDQTHTVEEHGGHGQGNPVLTQPETYLYVCSSIAGDPQKGHMMTTMGDISGYSWVWFTPNQSFNAEHVVSFDVGVTDNLLRRWWEVMIVPVTGPDLACAGARSPFDMPCEFTNQNGAPLSDSTGHRITDYPNDAIVFANGVLAGDVGIALNGAMFNPPGSHICAFDPEGCASVAIRRPMSITENSNGTITFAFGARTWTFPGQFPSGNWKVIFSSHAYTPLKDGVPRSLTDHWDNISVR